MFENLDQLLVMIIPLLLAITIHEAAHGYMASWYGDMTAKNLGRLTLNPMAHIDLVGTILIPFMLFVFQSPFLFGWAKPVPVNVLNLKKYREGSRMVALAGPVSNLIMMFLWAILLGLYKFFPENMMTLVYYMSQAGIMINAVLFVLNMLPILPLDGGRVVNSFFSLKWSNKFEKIEPYGIWIVLILVISGLFYQICYPIIQFLQSIAYFCAHFFGNLF